ncbi:hypothetical protein [Fusobacterium necrophorum]|uniref:Uncharacterized protein n=1 Tax=Fusobacterium necrophorum TaxID=859 RepID=A0A4Q2KZB0_9FUSO|nr:hypothetical protein [Fusobacterium necrophorum]AVQ20710.1 hypothetical protein C4N15_03250 [Fusobacterium necrophorum subsp. funduliforme]EHO21179.1 hypothetical protein HMPREF9466_00687 [Fusobacterium necrophorum subsp. funduliforme 1_1_36S]KDE68191.1 hypothetical protein FUSO7_13400 [Fusobacterium necrophorum BFTR-2]RXZ69001.1 hypothetical protein EPT53_08285 [Fusobacterium necrophorum]
MYKINHIENHDVKETLKKYSTPPKENKSKLKNIFIVVCFIAIMLFGWGYIVDFIEIAWSYISMGFILIAFLTLSAVISILSFILKLF